MKRTVFTWSCRCGTKSIIHCPPGIVEKVKQHLAEAGCWFCFWTTYLPLLTASHDRLSSER